MQDFVSGTYADWLYKTNLKSQMKKVQKIENEQAPQFAVAQRAPSKPPRFVSVADASLSSESVRDFKSTPEHRSQTLATCDACAATASKSSAAP